VNIHFAAAMAEDDVISEQTIDCFGVAAIDAFIDRHFHLSYMAFCIAIQSLFRLPGAFHPFAVSICFYGRSYQLITYLTNL